MALASQASLQADMDTLQAKIARLQQELASVLGEFRSLQAEAQLIEGAVVEEVGPALLHVHQAAPGSRAMFICLTALTKLKMDLHSDRGMPGGGGGPGCLCEAV